MTRRPFFRGSLLGVFGQFFNERFFNEQFFNGRFFKGC
jgi:hypothetical protein